MPKSLVDGQINIRTALTTRILGGGSKGDSFGLASLKRAPKDEAPKLRSENRHKGDEILTRTGNKGATVLGRMAKGHPVPPQVQPPQNQPPQNQQAQNQPQQIQPQQPQPGNVQPVIQQPVPQPNTEPSVAQRLQTAQDTLSKVGKELAGFRTDAPTGKPLTKEEQVKGDAATIGKQVKWKADADKELTSISKGLAGKIKELAVVEKTQPVDQVAVTQLKADIGKLKEARQNLIRLEMGVEFPGMGQNLDQPLVKAGVLTSLWALHGSGNQSVEPLIHEDAIKEISRVIDEFNDGAKTVAVGGGSPITLAEFKDVINNCIDVLGHCQDSKLAAKSIAEFKQLAIAVEFRANLEAATGHFEQILDKNPEFPISGAMRSFGSALPHIRQDGNSSDMAKLGRAAEGISILADMVKSGDLFPGMQGIDAAFDKASLPFKMDRGGNDAVAHLKDEYAKAGKQFPSDAHLALVGKAFDTLTVKERALLMDFVQSGEAPDIEAAHQHIGTVANEMTARRNDGRKAAEMRHGLTQLNKNLADVLTADRRQVLKPWTWGDKNVRVFNDGPQSVLKDGKLMTALAKFGDKATGKDVAILIARLSHFETETMRLEQKSFGLYPNLDQISQKPDPTKPLAHLGISNKNLADIGVSLDPTQGDNNIAEVSKAVMQLSEQGVGSINDVQTALKAINDVSKIVLKSELSQGLIRHYEGESARTLGQHLVNELIADADLSYRKQHRMPDLPPGMQTRPTMTDNNVTSFFHDRVDGLKASFDKAGPTVWGDLLTSATNYNTAEVKVVDNYKQRLQLDADVEDRRTFLTQKSEQLGLSLDPQSPQGLRSAKAILTALREQEDFEKFGTDGPRDRRDAALESLRGFDESSMRRPWHAKVRALFGGGDKPKIDDLKNLKEIAEAIVFLREDAPVLKDQLTANIEELGGALDDIIAERRSTNPGDMQRVTDMIRIAVLNEWKNNKADFTLKDGNVSEGFNPGAPPVRDAIMRTLDSWGFDKTRFQPEIDHVLYSRMTADDIVAWAGEAKWSQESIDAFRKDNPPRFSREGIVQGLKAVAHEFTIDGLLSRKVMDDNTRQSLLSMLEGFQEGDKLDLKAGQRITLDSGKIPVEPTGLAGIKAKISGAHIGQFEIERGGDGFKLHLRTGLDGKGSIDAVVGKKFNMGHGIELSAEASAGLEGGGSNLTGITLSFKNDASGAKALVNLVGKMIDGEKIDMWDWKDATDLGSSSETRTKISANASGVGRAQIGGKGPKLGGKEDVLGVGLSLNAQAGIARGTKGNETSSLKETTLKGEVEYSVTVGTSAAFYARIYNPFNIATGMAATESGGQKSADSTFGKNSEGKSNFSMTDNVQNTDLVNVGISATVSYADKWKHVTDGSGLFTKCENVRQSNIRQGLINAFAVCDTPEMRLALTKPGNEEFARNFASFMELAQTGDFIAVTYSIKPEKQAEANELVRRAITARRQGNEETAEMFDELARGIVNDDANYAPSKIGLIATSNQKAEVTNLNARWIKWDSFSDGKMEHTGVTLAIPMPK